MANNKIQLADGTVLLDLTSDTAVASDVASGKTFHLADGTQATGTGSGGTECDMYAGNTAPSGAQTGDLWIDTSDEGMPSVITAGDTPVLASSVMAATASGTSMTATGISIQVPRAGTYRFKFSAARTSTSGTFTAQLYKNGSAVSGATATWSSRQGTCSADIACAAGDTVAVYARSGSTSNYTIVGQLIACIDWNIWGS